MIRGLILSSTMTPHAHTTHRLPHLYFVTEQMPSVSHSYVNGGTGNRPLRLGFAIPNAPNTNQMKFYCKLLVAGFSLFHVNSRDCTTVHYTVVVDCWPTLGVLKAFAVPGLSAGQATMNPGDCYNLIKGPAAMYSDYVGGAFA